MTPMSYAMPQNYSRGGYKGGGGLGGPDPPFRGLVYI